MIFECVKIIIYFNHSLCLLFWGSTVVHIIHSSILEHVKSLQLEQLEELMEEGGKIRLSQVIQTVLEGYKEMDSTFQT